MPARRLRDIHFLAVAGVLTMILAGAGAFIAPPGGPGADTPSSFSAAPSGGKAAFYTLRQLGYRIERSYEPMTAITAEPSRTTLLITGTLPPSEQDRRALRTFVDRGGTVVLVGSQGAVFLSLDAAPPLPFAQPVTHRVVAPSPLATNAPEITMAPVASAPKFGPSYVTVFGASPDTLAVVTARSGKGRVIWWAAPTPLVNAHIDRSGNLQHLLNVAGAPAARDLLWDEHYHGHTRSLWSYAARTPLPWIGAQLGVILAFVFVTHSRRRGPVRARAVDARTSPLEFIDMLRALYKRAGANGAAVAAARARLRRSITSAIGLPADTSNEVIARAIASKTRVDPGELTRLLAEADRATNDGELDAAEALTLTRRLQQVTAGLSTTTY